MTADEDILLARRRQLVADVMVLRGRVELRDRAELLVTTSVRGLRADGVSWATLGEALGVSRQAAQQRYGRRS